MVAGWSKMSAVCATSKKSRRREYRSTSGTRLEWGRCSGSSGALRFGCSGDSLHFCGRQERPPKRSRSLLTHIALPLKPSYCLCIDCPVHSFNTHNRHHGARSSRVGLAHWHRQSTQPTTQDCRKERCSFHYHGAPTIQLLFLPH